MGPVVDGVKWLGVPVGDWATWLGVIVTIFVVIATWRAATVALDISTKDAEARKREERGRARVAAAFLYPDVVRLISHMNTLREQALAVSQVEEGHGINPQVAITRVALDLVRPIFARLSLDRIAILPHDIGAGLAASVGTMPLECDALESSIYCVLNFQKTIDGAREEMKEHAASITQSINGLSPFLLYFESEYPASNARNTMRAM